MCETRLVSSASVSTCRYSVRRGRRANGARPFGGPPVTGLIATFSFAVTKRGTVSLSFTTKTTSLPLATDETIYSSTDDSSGEDEDPWIPRPLSLPSEDPTKGRVGY